MSHSLSCLIDAAERSAILAFDHVSGRTPSNRERLDLIRELLDDVLVAGVVSHGVVAGWQAETCEARALAVRDAALAILKWPQTISAGACTETYVADLNDKLHAAIVAAQRVQIRDARPRLSQSQRGRVKLFDGVRATIDGIDVKCTPAQFAVVQTLIDAGRSLSPTELDKAAKRSDAGKHLKKLRNASTAWRDAISIPGMKGGKYDIL